MIIRRLSEAIQSQNWFTVIIEFLIVVLGVYLGLQANNWNEVRLDRIREGISLERLLNESEDAIVHIEAEFAGGQSRISAQLAMIQFLSSGDSTPADAEQVEWGFNSLNFLPAMSPPRTAYDELTASGGIQLIRSIGVRDAIADYYARLDWFDGQLAYFRQGFNVAEIDPAVLSLEYVKARYDPNSWDGRRNEFDWTGIRNHPNLETLMVDRHRDQIVTNANRESVLERARAMCKVIANELGRECVPPSEEVD